MKTTQILVIGFVAASAGWFAADAAERNKFPSVRRALTQPLEALPGHELRMDVVTFPPGAVSPNHRHPGEVFVYVLEGEIETRVGDGPVKQYTAGQTFYEPANTLHADSRNPSDEERAQILAVMIAEEGKPGLTLER
jgi:quercetin dioxygenase-like cupin family protein